MSRGGCCGGGVVATPTPSGTPMQQEIQSGVAMMSVGDFVEVQLDDGNIGDHSIKGLVTKRDYHYRVHGDIFLMHVDDIPAHTNPRITNMRVKLVQQETSYVGEGQLDMTPPKEETPPPPLPVFDTIEVSEEMEHVKLEMIDGVPSITNLKTISPKQQAALEREGVLSVKDVLSLGTEGLVKVKGIGPTIADNIMKEAAQILSSL